MVGELCPTLFDQLGLYFLNHSLNQASSLFVDQVEAVIILN